MIYENVREICDKKGISITDLEKKANLGNGTIGKWKKGAMPNMDSVISVAEALNVKVDKLLRKRG